ncbi:MAG: hypothetical protein HOV80_38550 [Polyangiaceae bacterium]|nr:hypothetical protein [Polyangiaceae bacterium]
MKRKIVMGLLALGTIGGFASGFASMGCRAQHRREAFENRVAETCVRAAKTVDREDRPEWADRAERAESRSKE